MFLAAALWGFEEFSLNTRMNTIDTGWWGRYYWFCCTSKKMDRWKSMWNFPPKKTSEAVEHPQNPWQPWQPWPQAAELLPWCWTPGRGISWRVDNGSSSMSLGQRGKKKKWFRWFFGWFFRWLFGWLQLIHKQIQMWLVKWVFFLVIKPWLSPRGTLFFVGNLAWSRPMYQLVINPVAQQKSNFWTTRHGSTLDARNIEV